MALQQNPRSPARKLPLATITLVTLLALFVYTRGSRMALEIDTTPISHPSPPVPPPVHQKQMPTKLPPLPPLPHTSDPSIDESLYFKDHVSAMCAALSVRYGQSFSETCSPSLLDLPGLVNPNPPSPELLEECGQPDSIPSINGGVFAAVKKLSDIPSPQSLPHHRVWLVGDSLIDQQQVRSHEEQIAVLIMRRLLYLIDCASSFSLYVGPIFAAFYF